MSYMEYKIGDVSKLLGITPEAIRYYEDQGIITPKKSETTGYRYYNVWDIHILIHARSYRQYGFSLSETAELLNKSDNAEILKRLSRQEEEIEARLLENIKLLRLLRDKKANIQESEDFLGEYRIEMRPEMYRFDNEKDYKLFEDAKVMGLMKDWINHVPFVYPSGLFRRESIEGGRDEYTFGLGLESKYAEALGITASKQVQFYPPKLCVYTCFGSHSKASLSTYKLEPALNYMTEHGLLLSGDVLSRVVLMRRENGEYINRHQVWLPFE